MTTEERDSCIDSVKSILSFNLEAIAAEAFAEEDLQSVRVEQFTLTELLAIVKRAAKQLLNELKGDTWKVLPDLMVDAHENLSESEDNTALLTKQLAYISSSIEDKDLTSWVPELSFVVRYQMHYGFWDRSKTRVHNPNDLNLAQSQSEVELLAQTLKKSLEETSKIRNQLESSIETLEEFTTQKEEQLTSINKALESASQALTEVRNAEKDASTSSGKIATLLEQADKMLDTSRNKIAQDRKTFNDIKEQVALLADSSAQRLNEIGVRGQLFDEVIDSAKEKEQHILDQETEIMRLIGHAADGRLATSFNDREKALNDRVTWWRNASLAVVLVAIAWVFFIFYDNPSQDKLGINWLILLANVVRTSPAFLLVLFCQSQYTKERNIQEEYAFKAAVSRTVTSYADMIGTGEVNERVKMLIETIQRLYIPPVLGKPLKPFSIRSKDFAQAAKSMAETAQSLKTTVAEVLPSLKPDSKAEKP